MQFHICLHGAACVRHVAVSGCGAAGAAGGSGLRNSRLAGVWLARVFSDGGGVPVGGAVVARLLCILDAYVPPPAYLDTPHVSHLFPEGLKFRLLACRFPRYYFLLNRQFPGNTRQEPGCVCG